MFVGKELWFDVGYKRYTTQIATTILSTRLWFDVGYKRYTTGLSVRKTGRGCGLMQDIKDIQPATKIVTKFCVVV